MDAPIRYEFRLAEKLDETMQHVFPELTMSQTATGTVLYGPVHDQEELLGILTRFRTMRLTVLEVRKLPD